MPLTLPKRSYATTTEIRALRGMKPEAIAAKLDTPLYYVRKVLARGDRLPGRPPHTGRTLRITPTPAQRAKILSILGHGKRAKSSK